MVGLSIVLESSNKTFSDRVISPKPHQVVNKSTVIITGIVSSVATETVNLCRGSCCSDSGFLQHCFLCRRKLLPAKDIYMYKGDRAFCSVECRSKQMIMDEEETLKTEYRSLMTVKTKKSDSPTSATLRHRWDQSNRAGGFGY